MAVCDGQIFSSKLSAEALKLSADGFTERIDRGIVPVVVE
jgi:hypothetical protein